jgi:hypothetical protein
MEKGEILTIFNNQFKDLVEDIALVFPENKDLHKVKSTIGQVMMITPKMIYKGFKKHVVDIYRLEILAGDIKFFVDKDYKNDITKLGGTNNIILDKIDSLRDPVRNMNMEDQAKVIKYMQNMLKLCDLYENTA